ncbi:MAG: hypothetical protein H7Y00_11680 [Fimbriimonadaceae bacterium]|nr:hypothetical protein [Chitinophagales bacterium]
MHTYIIEPGVSVGDLKLGMTRKEVHHVMKNNKVIRHGTEEDDPLLRELFYGAYAITITYSRGNIIRYISLHKNPEYKVLLYNHDVFSMPIDKMKQILEEKGAEYLEADSEPPGDFSFQINNMYISINSDQLNTITISEEKQNARNEEHIITTIFIGFPEDDDEEYAYDNNF